MRIFTRVCGINVGATLVCSYSPQSQSINCRLSTFRQCDIPRCRRLSDARSHETLFVCVIKNCNPLGEPGLAFRCLPRGVSSEAGDTCLGAALNFRRPGFSSNREATHRGPVSTTAATMSSLSSGNAGKSVGLRIGLAARGDVMTNSSARSSTRGDLPRRIPLPAFTHRRARDRSFFLRAGAGERPPQRDGEAPRLRREVFLRAPSVLRRRRGEAVHPKQSVRVRLSPRPTPRSRSRYPRDDFVRVRASNPTVPPLDRRHGRASSAWRARRYARDDEFQEIRIPLKSKKGRPPVFLTPPPGLEARRRARFVEWKWRRRGPPRRTRNFPRPVRWLPR